jgi:tetratricopeptide (TPR) repeat protein
MAARFLMLAGDRALLLDVAKAEEYYRRALELLRQDDARRAKVAARLAEVAFLAGRYGEAVVAYEQAIRDLRASGDSVGAAEALVWFATALRDRGETARAPALLAQAVELLEREHPGAELVLAYTHLARDHMFAGRMRECGVLAERAIALAHELGIEERSVRALQCRGAARWQAGDRGGLADLRSALQIGLDSGAGEDTAAAYINLGDHVWWSEGPAAGLDVYRAGIEFADRRGLVFRAQWLRAQSVWTLFELGRWDELLEVVHGVVEWDREHGPTQVAILALPFAARVRLLRNKVDAATRLAEVFVERAREMKDPQVLVPALAVAADIEQKRGDVPAALRLIHDVAEATHEERFWRAMYCVDLVRVAIATGAIEVAEELVVPPENFAPRQRLAALSARAAVAEAQGDLEYAAVQYTELAEAWFDYGFVYEQGMAMAGESRCLEGQGRDDEAQAARHRAAEVLIGLGIADSLSG